MSISSRSNFARIAVIIDSFDGFNTPRKSADIVDCLEASRATGYGLIRAMVKAQWLERVDHGLVRLGPKAEHLIYVPIETDQALKDISTALSVAELDPSAILAKRQQDQEWVPALLKLADTASYVRPGPFRLAYANASLGNFWRMAMLDSMHYAKHLHSERIASFQVADAGDDPRRQLEQVDRFVASGIDLLIISQSQVDDPALLGRLGELADAGLPIVAVDRRPSNPDCLVSFVTASDRRIGRISALWMAERLGGKGRVWMLSGVEGASPAIRRQAAALTAFGDFPGITVAAIAHTDWTEKGGYLAIDRLLAQGNPMPDGVWCDSGLQGIGSLKRFLGEGAALPAHTGGDLNEMYKLALHHKMPFIAVDYPAAMGARAVDVAMDILLGNPVARRVEVPVQVVLPRRCETSSVSADIWAETHVRWELPDNAILSQGPSLRERGTQPDKNPV